MDNDSPEKEFWLKIREGNVVYSLEVLKELKKITDNLDQYELELFGRDLDKSIEEEKRKREQTDKNFAEVRKLLKEIENRNLAQKKTPTHPQIALIYFYEGKTITRENAGEIAKSYGHDSGDRLYNMFTKYSKQQDRMGGAEEGTKFRNKIKLIESVIPFLAHNKEAQQQAMKEVAEMKQKEKEYE